MLNRCALVLLASLSLAPAVAGCSLVLSGGHANLPPTLTFEDVPGGPVAFESGQPVPTFDRQPRLSADLDGTWRFDAVHLDTSLSLSERKASLKGITVE